MAASKQKKIAKPIPAEAIILPPAVRDAQEGEDLTPVASPALDLQQALRDAGYRAHDARAHRNANVMLAVSVICVYALAMLMMVGSLTA